MPKRTWDINRDRWPSLGFHIGMGLREAQTRARQLNAQLHLRHQEERIKKIEDADQELRQRHAEPDLAQLSRTNNDFTFNLVSE